VLYQLSYTPKSNDLETAKPPICREIAGAPSLAPARGAGYSRSQRLVEPCRASFFAALATSRNRSLRRVRPLFEIEPKQKSRSAFDVNKNFNFNGDLHSAELSGSLLCLPKSATSFSAAQR
jgi:hypothetical protein